MVLSSQCKEKSLFFSAAFTLFNEVSLIRPAVCSCSNKMLSMAVIVESLNVEQMCCCCKLYKWDEQKLPEASQNKPGAKKADRRQTNNR
jgi:hypothetical protein